MQKSIAPREAITGAPVAPHQRSHAKAVGSFVPRLTRQAFEKYGFSAAALITDWPTIVGADLARWTEPERLKWPKLVNARGDVEEIDQGRPGATLILRVEPGRALDIQYKGRQIVERINAYFGYRAVADMRIVQGSLRATAAPRDALSIGAAKRREPVAVTGVADDALRAALESMAVGIAARGLSAGR